MSSPLERAFLRLQVLSKPNSLRRFLEGYLAVDDILNLRLTSRSLSRLADLNKVAFKTIYIHAPVLPGQTQLPDALEAIATSCRDVIVKIAFPPLNSDFLCEAVSFESACTASKSKRSSNTYSDVLEYYSTQYDEPPVVAWKFFVQRRPDEVDQHLLQQWLHVFSLLSRMQTLTIACNGDPAWPGCTDIEALLVILRICLERSNPRHLYTVCLSPIHAMGILHMRWAGAGAYGEANSSQNSVWQRIKNLELRIINPFIQDRLSTSQKQTFTKVLTDYIQSFQRTLTRLDLAWVGEEGPNPFALEVLPEHLRLPGCWLKLRELWFSNLTVDDKLIETIRKRTPELQSLNMSTPAQGRVTDGNQTTWYNLLNDSRAHKIEDHSVTGLLQEVTVSRLPESLQSRLAGVVFQKNQSH